MMDADGPLARVERTLWTVWCFISDAVNRLVRPQPAPGVGGEQNPSQASPGEGEPPDGGEAEDDIHSGEDALLAASLINSPQTEAILLSDDATATTAQKTPSSRCSEGKESEESAKEEQDQTGRDDPELLIVEDANRREKEETQSSPLHSEEDKREQHAGSKALTDDVVSEGETVGTVRVETAEDRQESSTGVELKENEDKTRHEHAFEATGGEGDWRTTADLRPEENDNMHKREREQQSDEEAGNSKVVLEVNQKMEADEEDVVRVVKREHVIGPTGENDEARLSRYNRGESVVTEEEEDDTNKLESFPLGRSEGRVVVLEELNTPACEETQEGLPESNNELGQDENITQRFLEVGDDEEFQSAGLPEEVESGVRESPQNAGDARLATSESVEEKGEGAGDTKSIVDLSGVRIPPHPDTEIQVFDCRLQAELSESQMKTDVRDLRMVDGTEAYLFGFGTDEAPYSSKDAGRSDQEVRGAPAEEVTDSADESLKVEAPGMTQDFAHTTVRGNNGLENVPVADCWSRSAGTVAEVQHDGAVSDLETEDNMERTCNRVEQEMQGRTETEASATMADELITESEKDNDLVRQYVLSTQVEAGEINNQFPRCEFETEKEISGIETADDFTSTAPRADLSTGESTRHVTDSEGSRSSSSSHQHLMDEEILDLWIEAAMSSQPNSQDGSVEETKTPDPLSQTSVPEISTTPMHQDSRTPREETQKERLKSAEAETGLEKDGDGVANDATGKQTEAAMSFFPPDGRLEMTASDSDEVAQSMSRQSTSGSEASSEEGLVCSESEKEGLDALPMEEERSGDTAERSPDTSDDSLDDHTEVDAPVLDFTPQRSRISLKNPRVRPPNNPRYLLNMPSLEPTPSPAPVKPPAALPFGGIGIKLPGLAAGFPLLKKTQRMVKDEDGQEIPSQEAETMPEEKGDRPEKEEAPHKPKWMPPKHPGFGNPLMSELKTKLKKTS